jgi:hypothetical protein
MAYVTEVSSFRVTKTLTGELERALSFLALYTSWRRLNISLKAI